MRNYRLIVALLMSWIGGGYLPSIAVGETPGSFVSVPYSAVDSQGNQWIIYANGMLQQRGAQPIYAQGAMLQINGEAMQSNSNRVRVDQKTGELVLDNLTAGGMSVTRRVLIKADEAYVRYVDIFKNATGQDQTIDVQLQTRVNFQMTAGQTIPDPHGKDRVLAWLGETQVNRTAVELLNGRSAANAFGLVSQPDNNLMQAEMSVKVPAGKSIAVMHIHTTAASIDAGTQLVNGWKDVKLLKGIAPETRRLLVNFNTQQSFIGDTEVLRGDLLDVVELRGGDQLKGTLKEETFGLHTFYGDIELPADRIVGLINVGAYHPRQLLVTGDGQVFGGELKKQTISLELSSGQLTAVPLAEVTRIGYRKRSGEEEAGDGDGDSGGGSGRAMVFLRTGDRLCVAPPPGAIDFITRYGTLKLDPKSIEAIAFDSDESPVHTAFLTDGSRVAGLVGGDSFAMNLSGGTATDTTQSSADGQAIAIPAAEVIRWQFGAKATDTGEDSPALKLTNGDVFAGALVGQLKLDTVFDAITINAAEIQRLSHAKDGGGDVQIDLWDGTHLSGSVEGPELTCGLISGPTVRVPVALVESYVQPQPTPSAMMVEQIRKVVGNLSADDWKTRDEAQTQLAAMGPMIAGVLKQLLPGAPPEAQQRMEAVLKQFADQKKGTGAGGQ